MPLNKETETNWIFVNPSMSGSVEQITHTHAHIYTQTRNFNEAQIFGAQSHINISLNAFFNIILIISAKNLFV